MSFLNPSFLWFLPLSAAPVLIHLLFAKKSLKIEFSSLFLLREVYFRRLNRIRISKWLILLMRCLALCFLLAAFSRPVANLAFFRNLLPSNSYSGGPLRVVFLIDRSYSMKCRFLGADRYGFSVKAVSAALKSLNRDDRAAFGFFSDSLEGPELAWSSDFENIRQKIRNSMPGSKTTDYKAALEKAYEFLSKEKDGKKIIFVASDSSMDGFRKSGNDLSRLSNYDSQTAVMGLFFEKPENNFWIEKIHADSIDDESGLYKSGSFGEKIKINSEVLSSTSSFAVLKMKIESGGAARFGKAVFNGKNFSILTFEIPLEGGDLNGKLTADHDALPEDNEYFYSFSKPAVKKRILLVWANPVSIKPGYGGYFIKQLFERVKESSVFELESMEASKAEGIAFENYSAVILCGLDAFNGRFKEKLSGPGLLWLIPSSVDKYGMRTVESMMGIKTAAAVSKKVFLEENKENPFFDKFDFSNYEVGKVSAARFFPVESPHAAIWNFSDGAVRYPALILKKSTTGGILLLWTSSLDLEFSDMAVKPVFAKWFFSSLAHALNMDFSLKKNMIFAGEKFDGRLKNSSMSKIEITAPDGKTNHVYSEGGNFSYELTDVCGIYRWKTSGAESGLPSRAVVEGSFAVNLDRSTGESLLETEDTPPWKKININDPLADFTAAAYGTEIWQIMLILGLVCSLVEFVLGSRKYVKD
ncbi:MAG: BatA domain-containing protein [Elusimicrobia bacterium]|nr:BatA domain-containing protein [Elusimicrobiota bacterium]